MGVEFRKIVIGRELGINGHLDGMTMPDLTISSDGKVIRYHAEIALSFQEQQQILSKMKELQREVK